MKPKTRFEWLLWRYYVVLWLTCTVLIVMISELIATPTLRWLFHDIPYHLPTWNRAGRMAAFVVLFSLFAGTLTWLYEKRSSGR
jgi:uncharacterized protein YybS (DUF2232 family)